MWVVTVYNMTNNATITTSAATTVVITATNNHLYQLFNDLIKNKNETLSGVIET